MNRLMQSSIILFLFIAVVLCSLKFGEAAGVKWTDIISAAFSASTFLFAVFAYLNWLPTKKRDVAIGTVDQFVSSIHDLYKTCSAARLYVGDLLDAEFERPEMDIDNERFALFKVDVKDAFFNVMRLDRKMLMYGVSYRKEFENLSESIDDYSFDFDYLIECLIESLQPDVLGLVDVDNSQELCRELHLLLFKVENWCSRIFNGRFDEVFSF